MKKWLLGRLKTHGQLIISRRTSFCFFFSCILLWVEQLNEAKVSEASVAVQSRPNCTGSLHDAAGLTTATGQDCWEQKVDGLVR